MSEVPLYRERGWEALNDLGRVEAEGVAFEGCAHPPAHHDLTIKLKAANKDLTIKLRVVAILQKVRGFCLDVHILLDQSTPSALTIHMHITI